VLGLEGRFLERGIAGLHRLVDLPILDHPRPAGRFLTAGSEDPVKPEPQPDVLPNGRKRRRSRK
jgi:hypothetical protein